MSLAAIWRSRPARERRIVGTGAFVLAAMLVVALAWVPLERTRTRLAAQLPALRASVSALERDAEEVRRVRALSPTTPANPAPLAALMAANAWARELPGAQLTVPDEKHVRLAGADISFTALLDWLMSAQAAQGLSVESARIDALPTPGRVRAELLLARS